MRAPPLRTRLTLSLLLTAACGATQPGTSPPTQVIVIAGNNQVSGAGYVLTDSLEAQVVDANGQPVSGQMVHWETSD